ncbi:hypothetical protein GC163_02730 [bacterium]|nr:hypothetical protein [bacterium]
MQSVLPQPTTHGLTAAELSNWIDTARHAKADLGLTGSDLGSDPLGAALRKLHHGVAADFDDSCLGTADETAHEEEGSSEQAERRQFPRCPAFGQVSIAPWPTGADYHPQFAAAFLKEAASAGELIDLSRNGLAFVVMHRCVTTELLVIRLTSEDASETYDTLCRVVRCKPLGDGRWQIVARFLLELPFEVAYDLCDHSTQMAANL